MRRTLLAAGLLALVPACGSAAPPAGVASVATAPAAPVGSVSPVASADPEEQGRKFAACMRENGVDMEDPGGDGGVRVFRKGSGDMKKVEEAMESCRQYAPVKDRAEVSEEDRERMRAFAKCMRENGVDMPDPDPDGGGAMIRKVRPDSPQFKKAREACEDLLPGNRRRP